MTTISQHNRFLSPWWSSFPGRGRVSAWRKARREAQELRLVVERLARLSPHYLDDIGLGDAAGLCDVPQTSLTAGRT
jgi:uncharacterized protein YjiS (DUF1127 family)